MAGFLLLSHQLMPHQHHSELSAGVHAEQHMNADTLFDWLELLFHEDFGNERHLADFTVSIPAFISQPADFFLTNPTLCNLSAGSEIVLPYKIYLEKIHAPVFIGGARFRGPPATC
jgi:hypothetical protein